MRVLIPPRAVLFTLVLVVILRAGAALAQQPSLVELSQKEQERRKALKTAATKVLTDKDLPTPTTPPPVSSTVTPTPLTAIEQKPDEERKDQKDETQWRNRMAQAREALRRAEAFADALQSRVNALSADAANRDDPYQRAKITDDRLKAIAELQRVQGEIEQSKKEITAIEDEARQAAVPAGWLR